MINSGADRGIRRVGLMGKRQMARGKQTVQERGRAGILEVKRFDKPANDSEIT